MGSLRRMPARAPVQSNQDNKEQAVKIAASEAKAVLGSLVRQAEQGQTIELTRYGKAVAVLISAERYERLARNLMEDK